MTWAEGIQFIPVNLSEKITLKHSSEFFLQKVKGNWGASHNSHRNKGLNKNNFQNNFSLR